VSGAVSLTFGSRLAVPRDYVASERKIKMSKALKKVDLKKAEEDQDIDMIMINAKDIDLYEMRDGQFTIIRKGKMEKMPAAQQGQEPGPCEIGVFLGYNWTVAEKVQLLEKVMEQIRAQGD
jgi:hypothetical protein